MFWLLNVFWPKDLDWCFGKFWDLNRASKILKCEKKPNNQPEPFGPVPFGSNHVGSFKKTRNVIYQISLAKLKKINIKKVQFYQKFIIWNFKNICSPWYDGCDHFHLFTNLLTSGLLSELGFELPVLTPSLKVLSVVLSVLASSICLVLSTRRKIWKTSLSILILRMNEFSSQSEFSRYAYYPQLCSW